jgi:hypothetical protein
MLVTFAALSAVVWYLASPLFVRTSIESPTEGQTVLGDFSREAEIFGMK